MLTGTNSTYKTHTHTNTHFAKSNEPQVFHTLETLSDDVVSIV